MSLFSRKKLLVTHNDKFHADDVFATAALSILLSGNIKVVRTRDEAMFTKGDYVYDVGGVYDPALNRFDHHQKGGAGVRENGIPYAAFGLVWKTYGETISGSKEVADKIDTDLVQPIDAHDNGIDLYTLKGDVAPYLIENMLGAFRPAWNEPQEFDEAFMKVVAMIIPFLERVIVRAKASVLGKSFIQKAYEESPDKRLIVLDGPYSWNNTLIEYLEPLYVVWPRMGTWGVGCVRKEKKSFENRKSLPEVWAGLRDADMARVSGVPDAVFCHNGRFLAVAKSKEGAIALAQKALLA